MSLSCVGAESFELTYQIGGIQEIVKVLQYTSDLYDPDYYETAWIGQIGEALTFEVEHNPTKDKFYALGTFQDQGRHTTGKTYYFAVGYPNDYIREAFEFYYGTGWRVRVAIKSENDLSGIVYSNHQVSHIDKEIYDRLLTEDVASTLRFESRYIYLHRPDRPSDSPATSQLNISQITRAGYYTYNVLISANGTLVKTVATTGRREPRYTPSDDIAIKEEAEAIETKTQEFPKDSPSQGVEVLLAPGNPHKKEVWLVDLDQEEEETGRRKVFEFEMLPSQGTPEHSVECIYPLGECPENTCAVNCGTHMCCYGTDGEPVHSYKL